MLFFDLHTHQPPAHLQDIAIESIDIRSPFTFQYDYYSIGIHPWNIHKDDLATVQDLAKDSHVVAIGECGLDKYSSHPIILQKEIFIAQALIAENVQKPLIIHCVKAWQELIAIRKSIKTDIPWIIHGFRGGEKLAEELLRFKFFLSFGIHFQTSALLAAWKAGRLFVETDVAKINIRKVYDIICSELSVSPFILSDSIITNLKKWPHLFLHINNNQEK